MEELPVKAGINAVANCIKGLKIVISSQKKWRDGIFYEKIHVKIEQIAT